MLHVSEETTAWLRMAGPVTSCDDWQPELNKPSLFSTVNTAELVEKVDEDKLAHDVDDLSAVFERLVDGEDFPLPCDDLLDDTAGEDIGADWIDCLDDDVVHVNELSAAFDVLVEEHEKTMETNEDEEMEDTDSDDEVGGNIKIIPSAPVWATMPPMDPRSSIRSPVFMNLDSRIPRIQVPRIDMSFSSTGPAVTVSDASGVSRPAQSLSPKSEKDKIAKYLHDSKTCWICKSSKTPEKKRALHRYLEKRTRRNWKRGPRYTGRSNVALSRVRNGGRFIGTSHWI